MRAIRLDYLPRYTYDDYKHWEGKWELIHGIPYAMSPSPSIPHQIVSNNIAWQLKESLKNCEKCIALLPVDWKISDDTVLQPDNMVICFEVENKSYITKAPSIIFEVLSPSTALKDRNLKFSIYESEGVEYFVIVDPEDKISKIYKLKDGKYIKIGDFGKEKFTFELKDCSFDFDFSKIWD